MIILGVLLSLCPLLQQCAGADRTSKPGPIPLIVLNHTVGNFFVLASDVPFRAMAAEPEVSWMEVEAVHGAETALRTVAIKSRPGNLPSGSYYSAVRVELMTEAGSDFLLIPVLLRVGAAYEKDFTGPYDLQDSLPAKYVRLHTDLPGIEVLHRLTPGAHFVFEVILK